MCRGYRSMRHPRRFCRPRAAFQREGRSRRRPARAGASSRRAPRPAASQKARAGVRSLRPAPRSRSRRGCPATSPHRAGRFRSIAIPRSPRRLPPPARSSSTASPATSARQARQPLPPFATGAHRACRPVAPANASSREPSMPHNRLASRFHTQRHGPLRQSLAPHPGSLVIESSVTPQLVVVREVFFSTRSLGVHTMSCVVVL